MEASMNALIIDQVSGHIREFLEKNGVNVDCVFLPSHDELRDIIGKYDLLVMRVDPKIDREILDAAQNLKAITISAVGTNHVDLEYAKRRGIRVVNAPGRNSNTVAELTMSKMLDLARNTMPANYTVKYLHKWNKYAWTGIELQHKTLGIIGCGKIGSRVGHFARAFDMNVIAYDPLLNETQIAEKGAKKVSKEELLKTSDIISIHAPLNDTTRNMISFSEFEQMRPGVIVLNMARGGILNEEAAYANLKSGKIRGIGVDVMASELSGGTMKGESTIDSPLFEFDNFIVSPHIGGGGTSDGLDILGEAVIHHICSIFGLTR